MNPHLNRASNLRPSSAGIYFNLYILSADNRSSAGYQSRSNSNARGEIVGSSSSNGENQIQNKGLAQSKSEENIIDMKFKSEEDVPNIPSSSSLNRKISGLPQ